MFKRNNFEIYQHLPLKFSYLLWLRLVFLQPLFFILKSCPNFCMYTLVNAHITMENHQFEWANPLFLWPCQLFNIFWYVYQRVYLWCWHFPPAMTSHLPIEHWQHDMSTTSYSRTPVAKSLKVLRNVLTPSPLKGACATCQGQRVKASRPWPRAVHMQRALQGL